MELELDEDSVKCINCGYIGDRHEFRKDENTCPKCHSVGTNIWAIEMKEDK